MIIGNINHLDLVPYLPAKLKLGIEYVRDNINSNTPLGRYDIDGDNMFVILMENPTRFIQDVDPEYHKKYIDIQIILEGEEGMAFSTLPPHTEVTDDRISSNDIAFVKTPVEETVLTAHANDFVIFLPYQVHKPQCAINNKITKIRKAVVKVALDYL